MCSRDPGCACDIADVCCTKEAFDRKGHLEVIKHASAQINRWPAWKRGEKEPPKGAKNTILNKRTDTIPDDAIFCGRGSVFGNPFKTGRDGTREQVIEKYREWFYATLKDSFFAEQVGALRGRVLVCFCRPLRCHVSVIAEYLERL